MGPFSRPTPIPEIDDSLIHTNHLDPIPTHHYKAKSVDCLKLANTSLTVEEPICSPLVDTSTSTENGDNTEATKGTTASDETAPLSSTVTVAPITTDALQVAPPGCKSTSDVSPRQSAYKEPNDSRVHKKVG